MTKYLLALLVLCAPAALAQSAVGTWRTEFDTQVGAQKYLFSFKQDGAAVTGTASPTGGRKYFLGSEGL